MSQGNTQEVTRRRGERGRAGDRQGAAVKKGWPTTKLGDLWRIEGGGRWRQPVIADYVLEYRNTKLAVVEAKARDKDLTEGLGQAKDYAGKLAVRFAYATNGKGVYQADMSPPSHSSQPTEGEVASFQRYLYYQPAVAA